MKLFVPSRCGQRDGSVLPVTLLVAMIIGITLAAFMDLSRSQHMAVIRSAVWNSCIPLAEAGVEEALTQVYLNRTNLASQGWSVSNNGLAMSNGVILAGTVYYRRRNLNGGNYLVAIQGSTTPTISSQGNLPKPLSSKDMLTRTIQVTTTGGALFSRALMARGNVTWNGSITSDSFDSQNPAYSTDGLYDSAKRKDNGSIGSLLGSISIGANGVIYGSIATGPTGASSTGPHGVVGDTAFITGGGSGIQAGHSANTLNVAIPDASVPFSSSVIPGGGNVTNSTVATNAVATTALVFPKVYVGTVASNNPSSTAYPAGTPYPVTTNVVTTTTGKGKNATTTTTTNYTFTQFAYSTNGYTTNSTVTYYDAILDNGDYYIVGLGGSTYVRGNARLHVQGNVTGNLTVANTGTLNMWVSGSISLSGNSPMNATGDALRLSVYGLPTCTSVTLSGNASWIGTLYAPEANLTFNGGGNNNADFSGAAIVNSATMNGHFSLHYDENLGKNGRSGTFVISSWIEL